MNRVQSIPASNEVVRRREGPGSAAKVELDGADCVGLSARIDSAAQRAANFSVKRESDERDQEKAFHTTRYGGTRDRVGKRMDKIYTA